MLLKKAARTAGALAALAVVACGPERLTVPRASTLIQERINGQAEGRYYEDIGPLLRVTGGRTLVDHRNSSGQVRTMIDQGLLTVVEDEIPTPDVSGSFKQAVPASIRDRNYVSEMVLQRSGVNVSGTFKTVSRSHDFNGGFFERALCDGTVNGAYAADGRSVALRWEVVTVHSGTWYDCGLSGVDLRIGWRSTEKAMTLDVLPNGVLEVRGNVRGGRYDEILQRDGATGRFTLKSFRYLPTDRLEQLSRGSAIQAGAIVITDVESVLLGDSDNSATADFGWKVEPAEAGRLLTRAGEKEGRGRAVFRKDSESRWVCVEVTGPPLFRG